MRSSDTGAAVDAIEYTCNICKSRNRRERTELGREGSSCDGCGSSVRARALMYMLSCELFGTPLAVPDFPRVKALRGIGLSDSHFDERLAKKLDYRNTYYHREPKFDVTNPDSQHTGAYDFLISSEVFEHVAPPALTAFENACRALKPAGVLLLTVPYALGAGTAEHFPELYDYGLATLRERTVLVNRTRSGELQVFEDLCFHGGPGSTLELRMYREDDLRKLIVAAGFSSVKVYAENYDPFGIVHAETWSLPMAARKQPFAMPLDAVSELMEQWSVNRSRLRRFAAERHELKAKFKKYHDWAVDYIAGLEKDLEVRAAWGADRDAKLQERTSWAQGLEKELAEGLANYERLEKEFAERTEWALASRAEVERLRARIAELEGKKWVRAGRRFGAV